jgi:hypothetical protein
LASTPALRAPRPAVRAVVFAALRAFCWRPRACPPFLAAAVRFDDERELVPDERALVPDELEPERELDEERLRGLEDERLRLDADRPPDERLLDERPPEDRLLEERLLPERLDPLDFFLPPELPLLRPSAICSPS